MNPAEIARQMSAGLRVVELAPDAFYVFEDARNRRGPYETPERAQCELASIEAGNDAPTRRRAAERDPGAPEGGSR